MKAADFSVGISHPDRLFIGGEWVTPASGRTFGIVDPATEEQFAEVAEADATDINRAVEAAKSAFEPWSRLSHHERAIMLQAVAENLGARADELGHLWTRQMGVLHKLTPPFASVSMYQFEAAAALAETFPFEEPFTAATGRPGRILREPVGVVGAIVPWNGPLLLASLKVAPALLAGCSLVLKASAEAPLELYVLAEAIEKAGIPPGVFNLVTADRTASERLVVHPDVDKISFTGSVPAGKRIAALCAERIARVTLELGGKSPAVVLEDADIESVADALHASSIRMSGQICASLTRVIAVDEVYDKLVQALEARFVKTRAGDPYDPASDLGPLANRAQLDRVESYIKIGVSEGARLVAGGGRPHAKGYYVEPTLFADVDNNSTIAQEEIFGPVLSAIRAKDEAEAIRLANDTRFGLNASVFTEDEERAIRIARQIKSGTVSWNRYSVDFIGGFGGFKQSGIGREGGEEGLRAYLEAKTLLL